MPSLDPSLDPSLCPCSCQRLEITLLLDRVADAIASEAALHGVAAEALLLRPPEEAEPYRRARSA